jgi:hypothetical protein
MVYVAAWAWLIPNPNRNDAGHERVWVCEVRDSTADLTEVVCPSAGAAVFIDCGLLRLTRRHQRDPSELMVFMDPSPSFPVLRFAVPNSR